MVSRRVIVALSLLGVAAAVVIVLEALHIRSLTAANDKWEMEHRFFCTATKWAIERDRKAFESDDPRRRKAALAQFAYSDVMYHSDTSLMMCLESLPERNMWCWLNENWRCLAAEAQQLQDALQVRYPL